MVTQAWPWHPGGTLKGSMATILDKITATKREVIARAKAARPQADVERAAAAAPAPRPFFEALAAEGPIRLIAEIKKASPSKGVIREDFQPVEIARTYEAHGASCLSVLTDVEYFQGSLDYLTTVRAAVGLPVLRKDFILDPYQVYEARAAGADAVLLIAECLDDCGLRSLHRLILDLGMAPLVELYEPTNLARVLETGATLIGVNNRNLHTFEVDLEHSMRIKKQVPDECVFVSESGIAGRTEVERLEAAGVDAILVGESLMRQADIGAAVDRLLGK
jgi:indole-3-glycerol phosphate synthase